ncbi:MAG: hypothetical protein ACRERR_14060 [Moraxellaceae bacterium]
MKMRYGAMQKSVLVTVMSMVCLSACSDPETPPPAPAPAPAPVVSAAPAPVIVSPAPESDAVALSEETLDKAKAEQDELAGRAADLEEQVKDGEMLLAMKAKQIKELEAQLKKDRAEKK